VTGDAPANLDVVDVLGVRRIVDLQRGAARIEDRDVPAARLVDLQLR
jgi:hypothetical protein